MHWESFTCYITSWQPWTAPHNGKYEAKQTLSKLPTDEWDTSKPPEAFKQHVGWNYAKEQICNQCTSRLSRYLWFTYESGGIFPTSSAVARSRFLAGVAITNFSMQLAVLYSKLDYLTYNPTSRYGTGYTFTWPRPTVEPIAMRRIMHENACIIQKQLQDKQKTSSDYTTFSLINELRRLVNWLINARSFYKKQEISNTIRSKTKYDEIQENIGHTGIIILYIYIILVRNHLVSVHNRNIY